MLDLEFEPWTGEELRQFRKSLWVTREERRAHENFVRSFPSTTDMARRVGITPDVWRSWELQGVPGHGWSALLRIYRDERRNIHPLDCSIRALEELAAIVGNFSALARELHVDRRTITKWRYEIGCVPGVQGYGRVVRICYEDIIMP